MCHNNASHFVIKKRGKNAFGGETYCNNNNLFLGAVEEKSSMSTNYQNPDDRPIVARGAYNLDFFDGDNEYETYHVLMNELVEQRFQENFARYLAMFATDAVTDDAFEREFTYERLLELDQQLERRGGLTASQMGFLLKPRRGRRIDCCICSDEVKGNEKSVELVCHHGFHCHCLQTWFAEHHTCPMCRHDVLDDLPEALRNLGTHPQADVDEDS